MHRWRRLLGFAALCAVSVLWIPPASWIAYPMSARIKARVKLIRSTDDDQFELLEVPAASSF